MLQDYREIICTRPGCANPHNLFDDLTSELAVRTAEQKYCQACGKALLLDDRYVPTKLLKHNSLGAVFLAGDRHQAGMPQCLVQQIEFDRYITAERRESLRKLLEREAARLRDLQQYPQIVSLDDFWIEIAPNCTQTESEEYFYLVRAVIDGQDLERELVAKGRFTEAEVTEVLMAMLQILELVHDRNTLHLNIKPTSIVRDRQGVLHLTDFGTFAEIQHAHRLTDHRTPCLMPVSDILFKAPEYWRGKCIRGTDLYALAVTCICLLTGKPVEELHDSNSRTSTGYWHQFAPNISDRLKAILDRLLSISVEPRFQSAREVLDALERAKVSTLTPQRQRRKKRPFSRAEIIFGAGFTGFEGFLVYLALTSWLAVSATSLASVGIIISGIIWLLSRRAIKPIDLTIFATASAIVVIFVPQFQGSLNVPTIIVSAMGLAVVAIVIAILLRFLFKVRF